MVMRLFDYQLISHTQIWTMIHMIVTISLSGITFDMRLCY